MQYEPPGVKLHQTDETDSRSFGIPSRLLTGTSAQAAAVSVAVSKDQLWRHPPERSALARWLSDHPSWFPCAAEHTKAAKTGAPPLQHHQKHCKPSTHGPHVSPRTFCELWHKPFCEKNLTCTLPWRDNAFSYNATNLQQNMLADAVRCPRVGNMCEEFR